jgi:hypothetical protein
MGGKQEQGEVCLANEPLGSAPEKTLLEAAIQHASRSRSPLNCELQDMKRDAGASSWVSVCKGGMGEMKGSGSGTSSADNAVIQQRLIAKSAFGTLTLNQTVNARRTGSCS